MPHYSIDQLLEQIIKKSDTVRDQGRNFEDLMQWWLCQDPVQKSRYRQGVYIRALG